MAHFWFSVKKAKNKPLHGSFSSFPQQANETSLFIAFANFTQHFVVDTPLPGKGVTRVYRCEYLPAPFPPPTEIDSV